MFELRECVLIDLLLPSLPSPLLPTLSPSLLPPTTTLPSPSSQLLHHG